MCIYLTVNWVPYEYPDIHSAQRKKSKYQSVWYQTEEQGWRVCWVGIMKLLLAATRRSSLSPAAVPERRKKKQEAFLCKTDGRSSWGESSCPRAPPAIMTPNTEFEKGNEEKAWNGKGVTHGISVGWCENARVSRLTWENSVGSARCQIVKWHRQSYTVCITRVLSG